MSQSITPAWGINTVIIGSTYILTVRLRMLRKYLDVSIYRDLQTLGVRASRNGEYVILKYEGIADSPHTSAIQPLLHKLRYESALAQVHDKYNTNPPGGGGAVAADYGDNSFFDPMEAEL